MLNCTKCQDARGLKQMAEIRTDAPEDRGKAFDNWSQCTQCGACYYGETAESFDSDDFTVSLYEVEPQAWQQSLQRARNCPAPNNPLCQCAAHKQGRTGILKLVHRDSVYYSD